MLSGFKRFGGRIRAFFAGRQMDSELEQELDAHLDMLTEDNLRKGLSPEQARREARLQVGGVTQLKEQHREVRGLPVLETILQDLRFAFRMIAKDRWFSAAAIVALGLGIGVNAVGFTIVNVAFLKGMPVKDSSQLFTPCFETKRGERCNVSYPEFQTLQAGIGELADLAAWDADAVNISDDRAFPEQVNGVWATANLFGLLGLQPILGRDFVPEDDRAGATPVAIIGYNLWRNRFGSDPNVLGKTMRFNGTSTTIIGVMPDRMRFPENHDVWVPWTPFHNETTSTGNAVGLSIAGRLRNGASRQAAEASLTRARQHAVPNPEPDEALLGVRARNFSEQFIGGKADDMFMAVMGAVCFVLMIACANVANLLLSRSGYRAREIAVRMTLGATRWRIVRQLLIESLLLGFLGGGLGLLLASAGVPLFEAALPAVEKPYWLVFTLDYTVVAYVAGICVVTAVLFGLVPALQVSRTDSNGALKENGRGSLGSRRTRRMSGVLVVTELTLAVVLLAGAGLMTRSFLKLYSLDLGFSPNNLVTLAMDLLQPHTRETTRSFHLELEDRVAAIPGVEAAAVTTGVPPRDRMERFIEIDGVGQTAPGAPRFVSVVSITPRYFEVIGVPIRRGRNFQATDGEPGSETVLINERLAAQFFPGEDPIGKRLRFPPFRQVPGRPPEAWRTIVGVTPTIRQGSVEDGYLSSVMYTPYRQEPDGGAYLLVRTKLSLGTISDAIRREVQMMDPNQPVRAAQTLEDWMARERWPYRVFGGLFLILAIISLMLSSVGLYAVMAYAVTQRTHEIGVRMAIGAQKPQIAWLVLKRGLWQVGIGLTLGIGGALALGFVMADLLVDIQPSDPVTLAGVTALLVVVSVLACLIPSRRAARVDPVVALRVE